MLRSTRSRSITTAGVPYSRAICRDNSVMPAPPKPANVVGMRRMSTRQFRLSLAAADMGSFPQRRHRRRCRQGEIAAGATCGLRGRTAVNVQKYLCLAAVLAGITFAAPAQAQQVLK